MRYCVFALLIAVGSIGPTGPLAAEDYPSPIVPEAAKGRLLATLLKDRAFMGTTLRTLPETEAVLERLGIGPVGGSDFCQDVLYAMRGEEDITFVEPVARADRYDDPIFKPWQDHCPALALNEVPDFPFGIGRQEKPAILDSMPGLSKLDDTHYGTRNFQLYVVDLDNDPANGAETIFHAEHGYSYWNAVMQMGLPLVPPPTDRNWNTILPPQDAPETLDFGPSTYSLLDLEQCRVSSVAAVMDPYLAGPPRQENFSGIVRYKGRNFIYSLWNDARYPKLNYSFDLLTMYWHKGKPFSLRICLMGEARPAEN
jgi:hypothetical protein